MSIEKREETVGFIGLGVMGIHMATHIMRREYPLVAFDINPARTQMLASHGARIAIDPAEVSKCSQTTVIMVDTTAQVEAVLFGDDGIVREAKAGDKIICMSTVDPQAVISFGKRLRERNIGMIDSPVAGMEKGAREGALKAFVGGETSDFEACRHVLEAMTSQINYMGPLGSGLTMKLVNNMMVQVGWIVASEALIMGAKAGLDPERMVEIISNATGNSGAFQYLGPRWLKRDFAGTRLDVTYKDIQHQIDLAKSVGVPTLMCSLAQQIFQMARCAGLGSEDGVAVIKVYEQLAGFSWDGTVSATRD